jgi:2,4-dienoyl-CoA reductase-like NADH-dependent reductase (Old Yellow Enzyme family)
MVPWRSNEEGYVTQNVKDWYARFARGRPGAIVVEATGIRDIPSGPLLRIGHNRFLPGLTELAELVKRESGGHTRLFIQVIDFLSIRRRPDREKFLDRFLEITDRHRSALGMTDASEQELRIALKALNDEDLASVLNDRERDSLECGARERVTDLELDHIRKLPNVLPDLFAAAALRAEKAGFDGVELHYAHAYTMASFLSATNTRDDGYGGTRENRVRLPLSVFKNVKQAVSDEFVVGARILADECIDGGSGSDDAQYFAEQVAGAGMDYISLSRGGKFDDAKQPKVGEAAYPYTGRSGYECMPQYISDEMGPFGRNFEASALIRKFIRDAGYDTPIVCAGGIHNFEMAEKLLHDGTADIIAAARQTLADPDWYLKIASGCGDQIRVCEYTNYCEGLDQKHKIVTCQLWDRVDRDKPGTPLSEDGKRRLVAPEWSPKT